MTVEHRYVPKEGTEIWCPVFFNESHPRYAEEMNVFYEALTQALCRYAGELSKDKTSGTCILVAKPSVTVSDNVYTVRYMLSLRHRGRTLMKKEWQHQWSDGVLLREKKVFFSGKCRLPVDGRKTKKV